MEIEIEGPHGTLACYLSQSSSKVKHAGQGSQALIVNFGLPVAKPTDTTDLFYKELVERVANQSGWLVMSLLCSGVSGSGSYFSPRNWCDDIEVAARYVVDNNRVSSVLLAGYDFAAITSLFVASRSDSVRGVATISPLLDLSGYIESPDLLAERARNAGVKVPLDEEEINSWRSELENLDPRKMAEKLDSKQWLFIHGRDDEVVGESAAKEFLFSSALSVESHFLSAADHQLVTDPRMMAILLGWMERNS